MTVIFLAHKYIQQPLLWGNDDPSNSKTIPKIQDGFQKLLLIISF